jgi:type II secretory pathway component GspD/PulD (secretin)
MKRILIVVVAGMIVLAGCKTTPPSTPLKKTWSSFDLPSEHAKQDLQPTPTIHFQNVELGQVLEIYGKYAGRNVLHGSLPDAKITFQSVSPVGKVRMLQLLDTVLAENNIAMVVVGDDAVKAVPADQAYAVPPPEIDLPWPQLPESSSMMMRTVHLKNLKPSEMVPVLAPFSHLRNSILAIDGKQLLILRDYSANIRVQLRMIEELEKKSSR